MKKYYLLLNILVLFTSSYAQDTIRVGNLVIVKPIKDSVEVNHYTPKTKRVEFSYPKAKKYNNIDNRTSYFDWDFGYTNFLDKTPVLLYTAMPLSIYPNTGDPLPYMYSGSLALNHLKSSNVNLWFVQQRVKLIKNFASLQYGVGFEMFNFRFEKNISFRDDIVGKMKYDNVQFSKNKLFVKYLTVPVKLNFNLTPGAKNPLHASIGMSAGYLLKARNKQISAERGKEKYDGTFNLNNWKISTIGELGFGDFTIYGSYSHTNLFDDKQTILNMTPIAIGIKLSDL
ncbi:MAG: hypothetical protein RLZZ196_1958 [Bacteroidota bacterium]|jgi:hypothetical protein